MAELGLRGAVDILSGGMNSTLGGFFEAVGTVMAEYTLDDLGGAR